MTERHLDLLQKHRELQKAFDDTLEMNRKLGSENWKFKKENEQLKARISYLEIYLKTLAFFGLTISFVIGLITLY